VKLRVSLHFAGDDIRSVGILSEQGRESIFAFDESFLASGLSPSPFRLPPARGVQAYDGRGGMETFGLFEDALPDGWGRRIVDTRFRRLRGRLPSLLERLACLGDDGMGALTFHPIDESMVEGDRGDFRLETLAESAWAFDDNRAEDVLPELRRAARSSGGARPKMNVGINPRTGLVCAPGAHLPQGYEPWIVKFNTRAEGPDAGRREFAYSEIARDAGADVAECRLIETKAGVFFATKRFDRSPGGRRLHMHSAAGLLHADFRTPGDECAILFKLSDALTRDYAAKTELFRRACLNVLFHNRDDHLKNFAFLMNEKGVWRPAPFFDFTFAQGPNGWQTLSVSGEGEHPGEADLLRLADDVSLRRADAAAVLDRVKSVRDEWRDRLQNLGVKLPTPPTI
jgi:serine/threonine-protein kinase HipA